MFRTKLDVDKHVENCLKKINNERERNLRSLPFAKLYLKVEEYEQARRYLSAYLSVKPFSAEAFALLGKTLEKQGKTELALDAYRSSLDIEPKQNNLILKVCDLLLSNDMSLDKNLARHYCEKAQSLDPNNPVVLALKERLIVAESTNGEEVTKLLLVELNSRPTDVSLRVRLLRHLLENNEIEHAYKHVSEIEQKNYAMFLNNSQWYEVATEVLMRYERDGPADKDLSWEFYMLLVSVLDRLVMLSLDERCNTRNSPESTGVLFKFDQTLHVAVQKAANCPERPFVVEFTNHYQGQLCFYLATLLYKHAKRDLLKYKDAVQLSLPLLFAAYHTQPPDIDAMWLKQVSENRHARMQRWRREATFRCSQAGHILQGFAKERKSLLDKAEHSASGLWREQLFKRLFVTRDHQKKMKSSYFVTCPQLVDITFRLPENTTLMNHDQEAQLMYPDNLHYLAWICLNSKFSKFKCTAFEGLQYSIKNLCNSAAESLTILDIEAFVYCTTLCAQSRLAEAKQQIFYTADKPSVLPAAVTELLCTSEQSKWFTSAYKQYKNQYESDYNDVRLVLIRGIEVVRCIGNHGLNVRILVKLANVFGERAKNCTKQSEIEFNEARAQLYWKTALPILEKIKNNQSVVCSAKRLFEYKGKEMPTNEVVKHIEDGKLFNAVQLMNRKEYEAALQLLDNLNNPYASFYQAQIYKLLAEDVLNQNKENVTSEMRSQHIIFLFRARDYFYLTLDRLRDPSTDKKHPLNAKLGSEIENMEKLLNGVDSDVTHRNEFDAVSVENVSSAESTGEQNGLYPNLPSTPFPITFPLNNLSMNVTPQRYDNSFRRESRPSPERLDAQLRQMQASKDATINQVLKQNRAVIESQKLFVGELTSSLTSLVDEVKNIKRAVEDLGTLKSTVGELKNTIDDMQTFRDVVHLVNDLKREIAELKKDTNKIKNNQLSDEDLYALDEEYGSEYNINNAAPAYNPANFYPNQAKQSLPLFPPAPALYPGMYQMYYPGLNLPPGALPFGPPEAQIPDYKAMGAYGQLPMGQVPLNPALGQPAPTQQSISQLLGQLQMPQTPAFRDTVPVTTAANISFGGPASLFPPASTAPKPAATSSKPPPVNVVITASDPLPKTSAPTTQVLSVTIPPQHLKGNMPPKTQPHNYQIPLPAGGTITTPSIINQPAPTVTTQSILSNVPSPIFSAVDKTPKGTGLGLQIEKTLSQTLNNSTKSNTSLNLSGIEEHDPCPDFVPIIPLPAEVPVNTGEENETVLFCEHAKLFRYVNKEWRERGVGSMKILRDKQSGKVRILMRRDQVHKICANHFITKEMELSPMNNNDRAFIWAANDYSDQEVMLETFCVRFRTGDEAKKFYGAFEDAKKSIEIEKKEEKDSTAATSYGGFRFTSPPAFKPQETVAAINVTSSQDVLKSSPFAGFTFGGKLNPVTTTTNIFSSPVSSTPKMFDAEPKSPTTPDQNSEEFEPTAVFVPVIPLPELVDVKTGEENAEILFESRAKLFRYDSAAKEWKERGTGIMKILKETIVRLVMRREHTHKVCCNHQLLKNMNFSKNNPKAITWAAQDFSEGELIIEKFTVRFKTEEQAVAFLKAIESAKELVDDNNTVISGKTVAIEEIKDDSNVVPKSSNKEEKKVKSAPVEPVKPIGFGDKFKPKPSNWECKNCYVINEGKDSRCVACETPKNSSTTPKKQTDSTKPGPQFSFGVAANTEVPSTGFLFGPKPGWGDAFKPKEGSWECKACLVRNDGDKAKCASCGTDKEPKDSSGRFTFGVTSAPTTPTTTGSWGSAFKPKPGSWDCTHCFVRNNADALRCAACEATKDGATPASKKDVPKGVDLSTGGLTFQFGMPTGSTTAKTDSKFVFTTTQPSTFSFTPTKTTQTDSKEVTKPFSFGLAPETPSKTTYSEEHEKFVFGSPQKHDFEFIPRSPRRQSGGQGDDESEASFVEDEGDHIYFKPVIPLPDKVEVKTGEEGETVLYSHRAKLFRFIDGEWKERGLGDVKILRTDETGSVRVLMRREQVLKICLNHRLSKDIEYLPKDSKTWLFSAADYSEGEINHWQFCIRFKSPEVAEEFKKAVDDALNSSQTDKMNEKDDSDDPEVEFISETNVTPEEEAEALRLKLPPKFMAYRQLPDCKCDICKQEDALLSSAGKASTSPSKSMQETVKSLLMKPSELSQIAASKFSSPGLVSAVTPTKPADDGSSAFKNFSFSLKDEKSNSAPTSNIFGNTSNTPTRENVFGTPKTSASIFGKGGNAGTPLFGNSGVFGAGSSANPIFGGNLFSTATMGLPLSSTASNVFGNTSMSSQIFTSSMTKPSTGGAANQEDKCQVGNTAPVFQTSLDTSTAASGTGTKEKQVAAENKEEFMLKADPELSFANFAKAANASAFGSVPTEGIKPFTFKDAGTPVFSSFVKGSDKSNKDGSQEDVNEGEDYDPHFEPIVPLPEAIVVSTGEEDETEVFNHRAKLYRYDAKEWKERGVGQMKILHHPAKDTYRFILRREVIHKVVLNMLITPETELLPMQNTENAYIWVGYNHTEDKSDIEKLAVRFKNEQLAQEFYSAVQKCIENIKDQQDKTLPSSVQNFGNVSTVSSSTASPGGNTLRNEDEEDADDGEEEDSDDEEDDKSFLFMKHCVLSEQLPDGEFHTLNVGELQVFYDSELYGSRVCFIDQSGETISSTLIGTNTEMKVSNLECTWKAVEWVQNEPSWRTLKATFTNPGDAEEFFCSYLESVQFAQASDITDSIPEGLEGEFKI